MTNTNNNNSKSSSSPSSSKKNFHTIDLQWMNQIESSVIENSNREADVQVTVTSRKIKNQKESPKDILFRTHHYEFLLEPNELFYKLKGNNQNSRFFVELKLLKNLTQMRKRKTTNNSNNTTASSSSILSSQESGGFSLSQQSIISDQSNESEEQRVVNTVNNSSTNAIVGLGAASENNNQTFYHQILILILFLNLKHLEEVSDLQIRTSPLPKVMKSYMQLQKKSLSNTPNSSAPHTPPSTPPQNNGSPNPRLPEKNQMLGITSSPSRVRVASTSTQNNETSENTKNTKKSVPKPPSTLLCTDVSISPHLSPGGESPGTMDSSLFFDNSIPFTPFDDIFNSTDVNIFTLSASGNNNVEEEFKEFSIGNDSLPVITYSFTEDPVNRVWTINLIWPTEKKALSWRGKFCFHIGIYRKDAASNNFKLVMCKVSSQFAVFSKPDVYLKKIKSSTTKKSESSSKKKSSSNNNTTENNNNLNNGNTKTALPIQSVPNNVDSNDNTLPAITTSSEEAIHQQLMPQLSQPLPPQRITLPSMSSLSHSIVPSSASLPLPTPSQVLSYPPSNNNPYIYPSIFSSSLIPSISVMPTNDKRKLEEASGSQLKKQKND
ncbi:hypothetical protein ABK040_004381 [Willaertia magna]